MSKHVIDAQNLSIEYQIGKNWLNVIRDVSLQINPLQIHGLVGESGSGKSTIGLSLMKFLAPNARITSGEIWFQDKDLVQESLTDMRQIWGKEISLVPQNPLDSLNPSMTIGRQMGELTQMHLGFDPYKAEKHAVEMLDKVRIADPETVVDRYPHQLSGGMQQRVMIAMALSTRPQLLILDEPTTALDVTTQAVILDLIRELVIAEEAAALYVSHDLGSVAQLCDYVTVLYAGEVMESAVVSELFNEQLHPYTMGLLASLPGAAKGDHSRLTTIEGVAPSLAERSGACVFANRCPIAIDQCHSEKPPLELTRDKYIRCWRWQEIEVGDIAVLSPPETDEPAINASNQHEVEYILEAQNLDKQFGEATFLGSRSSAGVGYGSCCRFCFNHCTPRYHSWASW